MKIFRYEFQGEVKYGILEEEYLREIEGDIFGEFRPGKTKVRISEVKILPPTVPTKIVGVVFNFRAHAMEMGKKVPEEPLIFFKPPSSLVGHLEPIVIPKGVRRIDYEGELAAVIKRKARKISDEENVEDYILGYTCMNDVTARDILEREGERARAKGYDTFTPLGPCIVREANYKRFKLKTFVNGKVRQSASMTNMIFPVPFIIRFLSRIMTLYPGDVIAFGTPGGVGPLQPGDRVDVQIEGIGILSNPVIKEEEEK